MSSPDFTHGGEFVDWGNEQQTIDERFIPLVEVARENIGQDVELMRWHPDPNDKIVRKFEQWWASQGRAIKRHVGPLPGFKVTTQSRRHKDLHVKIAYVRFNRQRPAVVRVEEAS